MTGEEIDLEGTLSRIRAARAHRLEGVVVRVIGLAVESQGPPCAIGEECLLLAADGALLSRAQVVGFSGHRVFAMPIDRVQGLSVGSRIVALGRRPTVGVGEHLLGRILDADGRPLEGPRLGEPAGRYPLEAVPPPALQRQRIREPFVTGVRSIDALMTLGRGQRLGIFAGSGVGKSALLGMIARHARADVAVIALVGERGREVRDFLEEDLGVEGLRHSVVYVATSDEPPLRRIRCALAATAAAEYFRDHGRQVVLLMDSITRVAMAQREIGLSMGEPPSTKGYPPSVFSLLPRLLERAGAIQNGGGITGLYSVYVEGDDLNDPIADAARSLLDGHVVLSRDLAARAHYPAIDVLGSISRLMPHVTSPDHLAAATSLRARMAALRDAEDLVLLGAYRAGSNAEVDAALRGRDALRALLVQPIEEGSDLGATQSALQRALAAGSGAAA
ncbi:MAG TPA: FliI/YscN family ATPase [Candidatus Polarisedimenticolia bacterium]|nr:FliI/YscN family ATPase [Candidatus Polarisedimenticolia bacterium]